MPAPPVPALPANEVNATALLHTLLDVSLTGIILFRPLYDATGATLVDLAYEHLNPAAQRMLRLPERPAESFLTLFPTAAFREGVFVFYRDTFLSGQQGRHEFNYQYDGLDGYFQLVAQRQGPLLVVSFTDTNDQPRTAVEQALRESQARERAARAEAETQRQRLYQVLTRMSANIALLSGPTHVYTLVNPEYECLFPSRSILGRTIREVIPELAGQGFYELFDQVYQTGEPYYTPEAEAWADYAGTGQPECRYYRISLEAIRDEQGQIEAVLNFAVDVTAQVVARQEVEQLNAELSAARAETELQRQYLHNVLTQAPAMICILQGPEHVFEFVNPPYQGLVGTRPLLGRPILEAMPELAGQAAYARLQDVYRTGETYHATEMLTQLDHDNEGRTELENRYYNFTCQARCSLAGDIDGILVVAYEVTAQVLARQQVQALNEELAATNQALGTTNAEYLMANTALAGAQQALQLANQELEARVQERTREVQRLFEQAPQAIAVLRGPTFLIEQANEHAAAIWGQPVAEVLGRPHFEALPEAAGQGYEELLTGVLTSGEPLVLHEVPIVLARAHIGRPDTGYYSILLKPLRDEQQQVDGVAVMWMEMTDQVLARQQVQTLNEELTATNEELQDTNRRLVRTNVDLDTFVYTASHDLKAPITNIEGILAALREHLPTEAQQQPTIAQLLQLLGSTVERFRFTIAQLTDLTKLQQTYAGPAEAVPLAALVQEVLLDMPPEAADAQLTVTIAPELVVHFAPKNARSIVYNLLSNAFKYRDPTRPSVVQVRAERQPQAVVLTVQDNGLGLDATQQSRLFGLFQRLHTHVEGTGVGLYLVKRLVENGGGTIAVESQPGQGTTFTVTFPA